MVWPPDGHVSLFDPGWLWSKSRPHSTPTAQVPWQAELAKELPVFEHAAIMTDDRALHGWLVALRDVGLALLRGVPCEPGEVDRIARRISLPRDTNFGVVFDVITKADANSNAYTSIELPGHVDLPTREYQPGFHSFIAWRIARRAGNRPMSTALPWPSTCASSTRTATVCCARRRSAFASTTRSPTTSGRRR